MNRKNVIIIGGAAIILIVVGIFLLFDNVQEIENKDVQNISNVTPSGISNDVNVVKNSVSNGEVSSNVKNDSYVEPVKNVSSYYVPDKNNPNEVK